jgi:hypothetical protein
MLDKRCWFPPLPPRRLGPCGNTRPRSPGPARQDRQIGTLRKVVAGGALARPRAEGPRRLAGRPARGLVAREVPSQTWTGPAVRAAAPPPRPVPCLARRPIAGWRRPPCVFDIARRTPSVAALVRRAACPLCYRPRLAGNYNNCRPILGDRPPTRAGLPRLGRAPAGGTSLAATARAPTQGGEVPGVPRRLAPRGPAGPPS